jgi:hypothetical protein
MCPLDFDPSTAEEGGGDYPPLRPGEYEFKIEEASETVFKSGNKGLKLKLLVAYEGTRDIPCYANLVYTPNMLWKVKHLLEGVGFDFESPPDAWELVGKAGWAQFGVKAGLDASGKPNGKEYLDVKDFSVDEDSADGKEYHSPPPAKKNGKAAAAKSAQQDDSDIPF